MKAKAEQRAKIWFCVQLNMTRNETVERLRDTRMNHLFLRFIMSVTALIVAQ